eukprot:2397452-Prymnesium_polylepis.2
MCRWRCKAWEGVRYRDTHRRTPIRHSVTVCATHRHATAHGQAVCERARGRYETAGFRHGTPYTRCSSRLWSIL